jgi:hypothetical protein
MNNLKTAFYNLTISYSRTAEDINLSNDILLYLFKSAIKAAIAYIFSLFDNEHTSFLYFTLLKVDFTTA